MSRASSGDTRTTRSSRATCSPPPTASSTARSCRSTASSPACSAATTRPAQMQLHAGFSDDGINWRIDPKRIQFQPTDGEPIALAIRLRPARLLDRRPLLRHLVQRLPRPDDRHGVDERLRHVPPDGERFLPFNRNGVLFPRKIGGKYVMLSRPSDNGHTPFGDIFVSQLAGPGSLGLPSPRDEPQRRLADRRRSAPARSRSKRATAG